MDSLHLPAQEVTVERSLRARERRELPHLSPTSTTTEAAMPDSIRMPRDELLLVAIMWLESNEGDGIEEEACRAVAGWLRREKDERFLRDEARKAGVPVARLRRALAAKGK
jgi:hypothetical protein